MRFSLSLLPFVLLASAARAAVEWPEWRGPGGQGVAPNARPPLHWSPTSNVTWRTAIPGRGWSSPVIGDGRVWLTTAMETAAKPADAARRLKANTGDQPLQLMEKVEFRAVAVERATGRILHDIPLLSEAEPQWVHELNSYASPTPFLDGNRLYCHFGTFGTACVDTDTGRIRWTNTTLRIMHENGPGSSPLVWRDFVILSLDGSDSQSIVALHKDTGTVAWRTPRTGKLRENIQFNKSYSTPMIVSVQGREVLVSQGPDWLYGYDPADGRELWKLGYGTQGFSHAARAVNGHGMIFLSTGFLRPEIEAVRYDTAGTPEIAWRYAKGAPTMPSPLLVGDHLYFVSDSGGMFTCLEARTGREVYRERLGGNHSSSPQLAGNNIYVCSREGETAVIAAGPTFKVLARNKLPGKIMASPVTVDDSLFLRTDAALYRIDAPKP